MTDQTTPEALAQLFHETYERLAPEHGYRTREASAKPWADVPDANKALMIATCAEVLNSVDSREQAAIAELDSINATVIQTGAAHGLSGLAAVRQLGTRYQEEKDRAERLSRAYNAIRAERNEARAEADSDPVVLDLRAQLSEAHTHEPATATGAPDPDPSEGPAPTARPRPAQGTEPLTLAQAASALHDWAGDLDDGARTDWPAGHPDIIRGIIRGIRAAADWLDARATYETETREQMRALVDRHGMADRTCLIGDDTRTPDAAVDAVVTILDRVVSGHLDDRDREGEDWSGPHPISIESDARRIIAAVQPHLIATAREAEEAPEPAEPTWRDVIRAMRAENIRLRPLYDIANWPADRTWQLIDHHGNELGIVTHETSYAGEEWTLALSYERGPSTRIGAEALQPADVLAAARLAGLIGYTDA